MLLLQLFIISFLIMLLSFWMFYKKRHVLAIMFLLMSILLMIVALSAMYLYPQHTPWG